jgi:hypothetical protein
VVLDDDAYLSSSMGRLIAGRTWQAALRICVRKHDREAAHPNPGTDERAGAIGLEETSSRTAHRARPEWCGHGVGPLTAGSSTPTTIGGPPAGRRNVSLPDAPRHDRFRSGESPGHNFRLAAIKTFLVSSLTVRVRAWPCTWLLFARRRSMNASSPRSRACCR